MRLAAYTDDVYRRHSGDLWATEAFGLFLGHLSGAVERLVIVGRLDPEERPGHHRLPGSVEFLPLRHHTGLTGALAAASTWPEALRRFWRALDDLDAVWLLGPHPLALAFAVAAALRRRRVVLGVRQDLPTYVRTRHDGNRLALAAAVALEGAWRAAARIFPVVAVGPDLARRYARGRSVLDLAVSLIEEDDLASADELGDGDGDGEVVVLSVGRLDAEKNPLLLADVLARLRAGDDRWRLVVCGDGALRDALEDRLTSLGLSDRAELLGYVPLERGLRERYRSSDLLLHVSWTEGFPQVLLEAFAAGLPVVATDVGGVRALASGAARLIPPGDAHAAATALEELAGDAGERRRLAEAGVACAARHTAAATCRRLAAFIQHG